MGKMVPLHRSRALLWKRWGRGQDSTYGEGEGMASVTGIEPATLGFGILCSTIELHAHRNGKQGNERAKTVAFRVFSVNSF